MASSKRKSLSPQVTGPSSDDVTVFNTGNDGDAQA